MAITASNPMNSYIASGSNNIFPYTFKVFTTSDLLITINGVVISSGFAVSGVGQGSGNITFTTAPAAGATVVIKRQTSFDRMTDYLTAGVLNADTLDNDLDRIVAMIQDIDRDITTTDFLTIVNKPTTLAGYGITDAAPSSHTTDETKHLTLAQNVLVDNIYVSASEINYLSGTNANIQTQLDNRANLSHVSDQTLHLTPAQNAWIDAITATSTEVNYLSGTTSSVQTQLNNKLNLTGGTMTGHLTLPPGFMGTYEAAHKAYVDFIANGKLNLSGGTLTGSLRVNAPILSHNSLLNNTGANNVAFGHASLQYNTTGYNNTGFGHASLQYNTTGHNNTGFGHASLQYNTTGFSNTASGYVALQLNTTGVQNTAIGVATLQYNTTGNSNTAAGNGALVFNNGGQNTAMGVNSLYFNKGGSFNAAMGFYTGFFNTSGNNNVLLGVSSGQNSVNGFNTTSIGAYSGSVPTMGHHSNTNIGYNAGNQQTITGGTTYTSVVVAAGVSNNTFGLTTNGDMIELQAQNTNGGFVAGAWYLFRHNGTNVVQWSGLSGTSTFISNGAVYGNSTCLGASSTVSGSNQVQLGDASTTTYVYGTVQNRSDERDKADIRDTVLGLDFINALRPVDFKWDLREDYEEKIISETEVDGNTVATIQVITHPKDGSRKRKRYHHGVVAQEVKAVIDSTGVDFGGFQDHSRSGGMERMTIGYDELIGPLIKAVQELSKEIEALKNQ